MHKLGLAAIAAALVAAPAFAATGVSDVVQSPSGFFVPDDSQTFNTPYYRSASQDWDWQHGAITTSFTTASLSVSAFDVDLNAGEVDNIYAMDNGSWVLLGSLSEGASAWSYSSFTLGSQFFDEVATGLRVRIDIDANNQGWLVTLGKSVVTVDGGVLPPVVPGAVPEPATWAMLIAGFGMVGAALRRRRAINAVA